MGENLHPSNSIFLLIIHLTSQPLAALKLPINPRYFIKIVKSEKIIHNQYYGTFEVPEWPEISCHEKKHQKKRNAKIHENVFFESFQRGVAKSGIGLNGFERSANEHTIEKMFGDKNRFRYPHFSEY